METTYPAADAAPNSRVTLPELSAPAVRHPERWIAVLRIVVGFWFLKSLWTKLHLPAGGLPIPRATDRWIGFMPVRVGEWAEVQPIGPVRSFLESVVLPNAALFAELAAWGESLVGISLAFGLLASWGALGGLFLMLTYVAASLGTSFNQQGFHILLIACLAAFLATRAGRAWGLDGWILRRRPALARRIPLL